MCEFPLQPTSSSPSPSLMAPPPLVDETLITMRISPVNDGGLCTVSIETNVEVSEFQFALVQSSGDLYAIQGTGASFQIKLFNLK